MPAQHLLTTNEDNSYYHVYNLGIENKNIFKDEQDYKVFLGFLKEYLSSPPDIESTKKDFNINGRTFRGTPHTRKNYFGKLELVAYNLLPNHFHLLLQQRTKDSLEGFVRSLCTRYSMYLNKKYQHTGSLFQGPYKLVQIKDLNLLLLLTRYLHKDGYSSYPEYLGNRITPWVKPDNTLSFLKATSSTSYKDFVEKYQPDEEDKELLSGITIESERQHHTRENPVSVATVHKSKPNPRIPELILSGSIFVILLSLGFSNIIVSSPIITHAPAPTPFVLPAKIEVEPEPEPVTETEEDLVVEEEAQEELKPGQMLIINNADGAAGVIIHQAPTIISRMIGSAKRDDKFEIVSKDSGWYEIKLADGSVGYILSKYIEVIQDK